jgi:hypothetical protein
MRKLLFCFLFFLFSGFIYEGYSQDDDVYYSKKSRDEQAGNPNYKSHIHTTISRFFLNDINLNFEYLLMKNISVGFGCGLYPSRKYNLIFPSINDPIFISFSLETKSPGVRSALFLNYYFDNFLEGNFVSFMTAYNSLPKLTFMEYSLTMGMANYLDNNFVFRFDFGVKLTDFKMNNYNFSIDPTQYLGSCGNISIGFLF